MLLKKSLFLGIAGGIISFVGASFAYFMNDSFNNLVYFLIGIGILILVFPFVLSSIIEGRIEREKEEKFLEFARELVESVESGTPISRSIINIGQKDFGSLSPYIVKLANQIQLGIPLQQALQTFAHDTGSRTIIRAITLIREADKTGGNINTILESVAQSVSEIEKLKAERRAAISSIVIEGYIIFFVFIIIMIVMEVQIIPMVSGISGIPSDISTDSLQGPVGNLGNFLGKNNLDPSDFTIAFLGLLIVQGFFAGLVIGKLSEGNIKAGIKHSFIMVSMAVLISTGAKLII
ncbi:MAG: type II secretion system F family protein [Candidatus Pacearchaeota archaeon]